jgi:hypothetical protein
MAASLDDILTTQKNGVVALGAIQRALNADIATYTTPVATGSTFVIAGSGRLLRVSVLVAGSTTGFVHNSATPTGAAASNALVACSNTIGVYEANVVFNAGLVIVPGTGQSVSITYTLG